MELKPDRQVLLDCVNTLMPFGKYRGRRICDLPVYYIVWCKNKGAIPKGKIGELMLNVLEIKSNDLSYIFHEIKRWK